MKRQKTKPDLNCWIRADFRNSEVPAETITGRITLHRLRANLWRVNHPGIYLGHSGPLRLVIPPWVGVMSTAGDGFCHL